MSLMQRRAPTWSWDGHVLIRGAATGHPGRQDGVVLIFVDSRDGKTCDSLVEKADAILASVTFDT